MEKVQDINEIELKGVDCLVKRMSLKVCNADGKEV